MKKLLFTLMLGLAICADAQTPTTTNPQSITNANLFSAVSASATSPCIQNEGQTVHQANYIVTGTPTSIQFRLEYSYNSDSATCTTGTWFPLSDDATDLVQGQVIGIGAYPFLRANLVQCVGCSPGTITLSASYTGSSAMPGNTYGFYNPSQQIRKVLFVNVSAGAAQSVTGIAAPFGSAAGFILINATGVLPGGSTLTVTVHVGNAAPILNGFTLPNTVGAFTLSIPEPSTQATSIDVSYSNGGASNKKINAYYYFYPPGQAVPYGAQPNTMSTSGSNNSESTSAANTAVSATIEVPASSAFIERAQLFSVSARCSAGSAQLTVKDGGTTNSLNNGGTQLWSTAATEVGTTTFKFQWNPGLASSPGNGMVVTLGTCGAANTGTLDVQASVF
jgi:hypothetical protein